MVAPPFNVEHSRIFGYRGRIGGSVLYSELLAPPSAASRRPLTARVRASTVDDQTCIDFLQWSLPRLGHRWPGYRKVRRLIAKRLNRRVAELGLAGLSAYRTFLLNEPAEWRQLDAMCRVPISRFYRDRGAFDVIVGQLLPELAAKANARGEEAVKCWSAGCASGEEPYTLTIAWRLCVARNWPAVKLNVLATDVDEIMIQRARAACYGRSSLKDLPQEWVDRALIRRGSVFCVAPEFRAGVEFARQDIRQLMPGGPFDLILCRNLVFTYFDEALQRRIADQLRERLLLGDFLVLGSHEALPAGVSGFVRLSPNLPLYRRRPP
jgi:chemotaxis protein methyltransferase CheR